MKTKTKQTTTDGFVDVAVFLIIGISALIVDLFIIPPLVMETTPIPGDNPIPIGTTKW
jgi:hypothetical protein